MTGKSKGKPKRLSVKKQAVKKGKGKKNGGHLHKRKKGKKNGGHLHKRKK